MSAVRFKTMDQYIFEQGHDCFYLDFFRPAGNPAEIAKCREEPVNEDFTDFD